MKTIKNTSIIMNEVDEIYLRKKDVIELIDDWIQGCRNHGILIGGFREEELKARIEGK